MTIRKRLENKAVRWALAAVLGLLLMFGTAAVMALLGDNPLEGSGFAAKAVIFAVSYTLSLYVIIRPSRKQPATSDTADRM